MALNGGPVVLRVWIVGFWMAVLVALALSLTATAAAAGWSVMRLPAGVDELTAVSCSSASTCTAVGRGAEVLRLAGGRWSIEQPPNTADSYLTGVSCVSPIGCIAVGTISPPECCGPSLPLAEQWLGASWSREPIPPFPSGHAPSTDLAGVSCTTERACIAVGDIVTSVSGMWPDVVVTTGRSSSACAAHAGRSARRPTRHSPQTAISPVSRVRLRPSVSRSATAPTRGAAISGH